MTTADFQARVRQQGSLISSWASIAEEPPPTPVGAFVPDCPKHDPLHSPVPLFQTLIGTTPWQTVWGRWTTLTPPYVVVYNTGTKACPI